MATSSSSKDAYRNLSDRGLIEYQDKIIREQDQHLDDIERSVGTLKDASIAMGQEIATQTVLLDQLGDGIDRSQSRVGRNRRWLSAYMQRTGTCKIWLVIIVSTALLILVIAYL